MSAELGEAVFARLSADQAVTALVADRIFPDELPEGTELPAVVYQIISDIPENSFDGDAASRRKLARLQVDCYARADKGKTGRYRLAHQVSTAVENVIANLSEVDLSGSLEAARDYFDNDTGYARVEMDFWLFR
jgi:hypothetical protein